MKKLLVCAVLCMLAACRSEKKNTVSAGADNDSPQAEWTGPKNIGIDVGSAKKRTFDISDRIDTSFFAVVPLETGKNCLIGNKITRFFIRGDRMYLLDKQSKGIFIYDMNGAFIGKVQSVGAGPMEYTDISDAFVTENNIVVLDNYSLKVLVYDRDGNYGKSFKMDTWFANAVFCMHGRIYYINDWSVLQAGSYHLFSTDMDGKDLEKYIPFDQPSMRAIVTVAEQCYVFSGDRVEITLPSSDTVYSVGKSGVRAEYVLDFKDKFLPKEYWKDGYRELLKKGVAYSYVLGVSNMLGLGDCLLFSFRYGSTFPNYYKAMYDRRTQAVNVFQYLSMDYFGLTRSFALSFNTGEYLVSIMPADFFRFYYKGNPPAGPAKYNARINEIFTRINDEDNPVVFLYKLKSF